MANVPDFGPIPGTLWAPTWGEITGNLAILIAAIGIGITIWQINRVNIKAEARFEDAVQAVKALTVTLDGIKTELYEHKLDVARRYVDTDSLDKIEARLFDALQIVAASITSLRDRLDKVLDERKRD
jgi:hypothetical protein